MEDEAAEPSHGPAPRATAWPKLVRRGPIAIALVLVVAVAALLAIAATAGEPPDANPGAPPASSSLSPRDEALRTQLAANGGVRMALLGSVSTVGRIFCGINVVGADADQARLYVWILCEDITLGPDAAVRAGGSGPAVVQVNGRGARTRVLGVSLPRQQSLQQDILRLFPPGVAETMRTGRVPVAPSARRLLGEARNT